MEQVPGRTCDPVKRGAHIGVGLLTGLVTLWGPILELSVPEGLHPEEGGPHDGTVCEGLFPGEGPHAGPEEECEEEGAAQTMR